MSNGPWAEICYDKGQEGKFLRWVPLLDKKIFPHQHRKLGKKEFCYEWERPAYWLNWFNPDLGFQSQHPQPSKDKIETYIFVDCTTPWDGNKR